MKRFNLIFAVVVGTFFYGSAFATTLVTDQFINYATGQLGSAGAGGGGAIPGWNSPLNNVTVTNGSGSLDGTGLGLVESAGDEVFINGNASTNGGSTIATLPQGCYEKWDAATGQFPSTNTVNLYSSFLYRFNVGTDMTDGVAYMIAGMYLQNGGIQSASGADAYWQLFARNVGGNIQLGIAKNVFATGNIGITNWAAVNIAAGQTFFVVVRLQINATNGLTSVTNGVDDIADLWVNPAPNTFGVDETSVPSPSATSPIGDGTVPTSNTGPGRFFVVASGPSANLDELRISTNWADVTPPLGQCITAGISRDLTNVTQSAEIGATLSIGAIGTAPTFQWQESGPGSETWTNIPGAVLSSYTTPNLQLATDNGDKFRVIINVGCDDSSVTSSVSTVTLTAPVVTPVGVIMDDTFDDGLRGNPPVTPNNSLWFTSVTADLDANPGDTGVNGMVATPISGTSSLYLGYFVDESTTNLPVDLSIGHEIKVTFPFITGTFNSFTNNGALRFGLFDYADGGTLITADSSSQPNSVTGSAGNGVNVRGYMLSVDFGTNFTVNSPLSLLARNGLSDVNLMGTTSDFISLGSGPSGGGFSNAPAFAPNTQYTLTFSVTRTDVNTSSVAVAITGGGTNWAFTATDTNNFGYHRFDAFAMRPNQLENAPDNFIIPEFKVEVLAVTLTPTSIMITNVSHTANSVTLSWNPTPSGAFTYTVQRKNGLTDATWTTLQTGITTTSFTDTTATGNTGFYRVSSP